MSGIDPRSKSETQELTPKEAFFVERYLTHWNGSRAAAEAGYMTEGAKDPHTKQAANEILLKPYVRKVINDRMAAVVMEANEALARLATIARGDITEFITRSPNGEWEIDVQKIKDSEHGFVIKSFNVSRFGGLNIEMYSAADALDRICKHLNLYKADETVVNISLSAWGQFVQAAKAKSADLVDDDEPIDAVASDPHGELSPGQLASEEPGQLASEEPGQPATSEPEVQ